MPALQIKECPLDVYTRLKESAARENRNISQQMLSIIERYLDAQDKGSTSSFPYSEAASLDHMPPSQHWGGEASQYLEVHYPQGSCIEKRRAAFDRISKLPPVKLQEDGVTIVDLVRESRDEAR